MDDADFLLRLRNDPATVAASRQQRPVEEVEHRVWLAAALRDPASALYVAWYYPGGPAIGTARVDHWDGPICEVNFTVAPEARGNHVGQRLIREAVKLDPHHCPLWIAHVRRENIASLKAFLSLGWRIGIYGGKGLVLLGYVRTGLE